MTLTYGFYRTVQFIESSTFCTTFTVRNTIHIQSIVKIIVNLTLFGSLFFRYRLFEVYVGFRSFKTIEILKEESVAIFKSRSSLLLVRQK